MKERKDIKLHTKVNASTFMVLKAKCRAGGFKSIYKLMQALLESFCRYSDTDYDRTFQEGMRKELDEMFDELMRGLPAEHHKTTDRRSRR